MKQLKPPSSSQLEKDQKLESCILLTQHETMKFIQLLSDYVYMNASSPSFQGLVRRNRETFFKEFQYNVENVLNLLMGIKLYFCKKEYSNDHLANMIYNPEQQYKDYFSCNIQVIMKSVERYKNNILYWKDKEGFEDNHFLRGQCTFFQEMLVDISSFNDELYRWMASMYSKLRKEKKVEEDVTMFSEKYRPRASRRTQLMAAEILYASHQIVSRHLYLNDMSPVPVAIFQLRQAIEIRMLEILGIAVITKDGLPMKITGNDFFDLPGLESSVIFPVDFSNIKKIYSWTNIYIHMALCNNYWLLDFAQAYLQDFVYIKPIIKKSFSDFLKETICNFAAVSEKNVTMRNCIDADIIDDDVEFQRIEELIAKKGFIAYQKEKEERERCAIESFIQKNQNPKSSSKSRQEKSVE